MSIDDQIRSLLSDAMEPVDPPAGLADDLIARAAGGTGGASGGSGAGTGSGMFGLPMILVGAVLAGVLVGGAFGLFGTGGSARATASLDAVPVAACPGGSEIGTLHRGDRVLVTGKSGDWLAVRNVRGQLETVFVRTEHVDPDETLTGLPEAGCDESGSFTVSPTTTAPDATSTTLPSETTTTLLPDTTTVPVDTTTTVPPETTTTTVPSTTTTAAPDTTPPLIGQPGASENDIWEEDGFGCSFSAGTPRQTTISAIVTDAVGVTEVTASWSDPDGSHTVNMPKSGSTYSTTIGPYDAGTWGLFEPFDHFLIVTIVARDAAGNKSSNDVGVTVWNIGDCVD